MNPENGGNRAKNAGEGGEKIVKPETIKTLGDRTMDLENYRAEEEQKEREAKEQTEQEQNANESKIAELKAQMDALVAEQARLAEAQHQHEQEIQNIIQQRAEKTEAMRKGITGMAEWYDKHPNEIDEIIRPEMEHDADYYRKWQQETGQSFAGIIAESVRIGELLQREDLKDITAEELDQEAKALEQKQRDFADYQAIIARRNGDMSAKLSDNYFDAKNVEKIVEAKKAETEDAKDNNTIDMSKEISSQVDKIMDQSDKEHEEMLSKKLDQEGEELVNLSDAEIDKKIEAAQAEIAKFQEERAKRSIFKLMEEKGSRGNDIDNAVEKAKLEARERHIVSIEDAYRKKSLKERAGAAARRAIMGMMVVLSLGGITTSLNGCTNRLAGGMNATPVESSAIPGATEVAQDESENPAQEQGWMSRAGEQGEQSLDKNLAQEQGWMSRAGEQGEQSLDKYIAKYYTTDKEGNRHDRSDNLHRKVDFKAENPFDSEVKEKGEKLTADKKETKASFGTTLAPNGLDGDIDAAEAEFNRNLMNRAATQEELAVSLLAGIGGSDALKDVEFSTGNSIDEPAKLEIANGNISPEAINRDSRILAALPAEQQQKIMNALSEGWQNLINDKEFSLVNWKGVYSSQTMKPAENGAIAHDIVIQDNVKRNVEFSVYQVNEDATKLTVLQAMGKINPDVTLEQAQEKGLLKSWQVGLKADCGGQWVAKKIVKKVVKKAAPAPTQVVAPVLPVANPVVTYSEATPETPPSTPPTSNPEVPPEVPPVIPPNPNPNPNPQPQPNPNPNPNPEQPQPKNPNVNPWGGDTKPLPVTPEQPSEPGQEPIQKGQETPPAKNEDGVNEKPGDQAPWSEEPTTPPEDTNTGGEGEQQPGAMDEAIRRLQPQEQQGEQQ